MKTLDWKSSRVRWKETIELKTSRIQPKQMVYIIFKLPIRFKAIHKLLARFRLLRTFNNYIQNESYTLRRYLLFFAFVCAFSYSFHLLISAHLNRWLSIEARNTVTSNEWSTNWMKTLLTNYEALNANVSSLKRICSTLTSDEHEHNTNNTPCAVLCFFVRLFIVEQWIIINGAVDSSCVQSGQNRQNCFSTNRKLIDQPSFKVNIYVDSDDTQYIGSLFLSLFVLHQFTLTTLSMSFSHAKTESTRYTQNRRYIIHSILLDEL